MRSVGVLVGWFAHELQQNLWMVECRSAQTTSRDCECHPHQLLLDDPPSVVCHLCTVPTLLWSSSGLCEIPAATLGDARGHSRRAAWRPSSTIDHPPRCTSKSHTLIGVVQPWRRPPSSPPATPSPTESRPPSGSGLHGHTRTIAPRSSTQTREQ